MDNGLGRPVPIYEAGAGLMRNEHFQIAYATTDMDRACALFAEHFGIKEFRRLEGALPEGGHIRMEIAWAGGTMYELVCAQGAGAGIFRTGLPDDGFGLRVHHLGYYVPNAEAWQAVLDEIESSGRKVVRETNVPGFLQARIVEASELGHYLEYIFPDVGGVAFFEGAPNN